jgi:acetyltransferase-like isoleucine patch superfamily enzyme
MHKMLKYFFKIIRKLDIRWKKQELVDSFGRVGENFRFDPNSIFIDPHEMTFGDHVFINRSAHFSGKIRVGNDVMFGPNVMIFAHDHYFGVSGKTLYEIESIWRHQPVNIGNHCWIGANCTIVAGAQINDGTVVAAGSVVKGSTPPFCLIAGVPAKPIRLIFSDSALKEHLKALSYSNSQIAEIIRERSRLTDGRRLKVIQRDLEN